jgi:cell division initiation protein
MKVTPLDLRQLRFRTSFRGYNPAEVGAFLAEIADDYEKALRDNDRVKQELSRVQAALDEHREQERNLRNTLLTAQRLADEIRENARQEAARIVREAEGRADLLLQKTQARLEDVQRDIDGLRLKRKDAETALASTITTLNNALDFIRQQEHGERDEKILLHRPRHIDPARPREAEASERDPLRLDAKN